MSNTSALGTGILIPIDYTSRDYLSIRSDLINAIPSFLPEWTSTSNSDFGVVLLELFSYVADLENYYIDRIANESFLATAQQRSSVLNIAYLIDYAPSDTVPASTTLSITLQPNTPSFVLPKGSQFSTVGSATQGPLIFELAQDHTIPANTTQNTTVLNSTTENSTTTGPTTTVPLGTLSGPSAVSSASGSPSASQTVPLTVVQGVTINSEALGTSTGNANQTFTLYNLGVIDNSVQVYVDEDGNGAKPWQSVAHLTDAGPYDAVFVVSVDANGVYYVTFGDGVSGRIPNPSAIITATYRVGGGSAGNVGANQITVNLTGEAYIASVTNPNSAVGGADPESIAQIQANAPRSITAAGRCVSIQDYASVALEVPSVSKASAETTAAPSAINLYVHPPGGPYKSADLATLVGSMEALLTYGGPGPVSSTGQSGYLDSRKMVGTSVTVLPPQYDNAITGALSTGYVPIVLALEVQVLPQYTNLQVQQDVLTALNTIFDFGSLVFGQRISLSLVYHTIQMVPGVDFLVVTAMSRGDAPAGTLGDIQCALNEIPVVGNPDTGATQISVNVSGGL